jgi:hypothetical protein
VDVRLSTRPSRIGALVVLAAMTLLLGGWRLSSLPYPWNPKGHAVVKSPDGVSHVIRSSFCSFGLHGGVRLRFGGKLAERSVTRDRPYIHLVAQRREANPSVLDIFDGVITSPPAWGWDDADHVGTARIQVDRRRGTFVLRDSNGRPRYTGTWNCG